MKTPYAVPESHVLDLVFKSPLCSASNQFGTEEVGGYTNIFGDEPES